MVFNLVAAGFPPEGSPTPSAGGVPMVTTLWGVFTWGEFEGAPGKAKMYLALMFVFYCLGISLVAKAND